jgi:hypothetical protein
MLFSPGKTVDGRPELSLIQHLWLYKHIRCEAGTSDLARVCPITGIVLQQAMDDHQIIISTTRILDNFPSLRFRMKDSPGNCKVWMALINKVRSRDHVAAPLLSESIARLAVFER